MSGSLSLSLIFLLPKQVTKKIHFSKFTMTGHEIRGRKRFDILSLSSDEKSPCFSSVLRFNEHTQIRFRQFRKKLTELFVFYKFDKT